MIFQPKFISVDRLTDFFKAMLAAPAVCLFVCFKSYKKSFLKKYKVCRYLQLFYYAHFS